MIVIEINIICRCSVTCLFCLQSSILINVYINLFYDDLLVWQSYCKITGHLIFFFFFKKTITVNLHDLQ